MTRLEGLAWVEVRYRGSNGLAPLQQAFLRRLCILQRRSEFNIRKYSVHIWRIFSESSVNPTILPETLRTPGPRIPVLLKRLLNINSHTSDLWKFSSCILNLILAMPQLATRSKRWDQYIIYTWKRLHGYWFGTNLLCHRECPCTPVLFDRLPKALLHHQSWYIHKPGYG